MKSHVRSLCFVLLGGACSAASEPREALDATVSPASGDAGEDGGGNGDGDGAGDGDGGTPVRPDDAGSEPRDAAVGPEADGGLTDSGVSDGGPRDSGATDEDGGFVVPEVEWPDLSQEGLPEDDVDPESVFWTFVRDGRTLKLVGFDVAAGTLLPNPVLLSGDTDWIREAETWGKGIFRYAVPPWGNQATQVVDARNNWTVLGSEAPNDFSSTRVGKRVRSADGQSIDASKRWLSVQNNGTNVYVVSGDAQRAASVTTVYTQASEGTPLQLVGFTPLSALYLESGTVSALAPVAGASLTTFRALDGTNPNTWIRASFPSSLALRDASGGSVPYYVDEHGATLEVSGLLPREDVHTLEYQGDQTYQRGKGGIVLLRDRRATRVMAVTDYTWWGISEYVPRVWFKAQHMLMSPNGARSLLLYNGGGGLADVYLSPYPTDCPAGTRPGASVEVEDTSSEGDELVALVKLSQQCWGPAETTYKHTLMAWRYDLTTKQRTLTTLLTSTEPAFVPYELFDHGRYAVLVGFTRSLEGAPAYEEQVFDAFDRIDTRTAERRSFGFGFTVLRGERWSVYH